VRAGAEPGFVFCARVGDHPDPLYRYVAMGSDGPEVVADTLACLAHAHATFDTDRELDEETHRLAYDAWALAREDIHRQWTAATDPRNLQPAIPKTMRDAEELVRDNPPAGMVPEELNRVLNTLLNPFGSRIQRSIKEAMRSSENPREAAEAVVRLVQEEGLQPSPPPEPLPVISAEDVHLVCWMGIAREGGQV
jgi:hypothetical protein